MHHFLQLARQAAEASLNLTARPLLSYVLLGHVQHVHGNRLSVQDIQKQQFPEWYQQGIEVHPRSLLLRVTLLNTLRQEWGGSRDHMFHFIEAQQDKLQREDLYLLWGEFHANLSHHLFHFQNNVPEALKAIEEAIPYHTRFYYSKVYYLHFVNEPQALALLEERMDLDRDTIRRQTIGKAEYLADEVLEKKNSLSRKMFEYLSWRAEDGDLEALPMLGQALVNDQAMDPQHPPHFWLEWALNEGAVQAGKVYAEYLRDKSDGLKESFQVRMRKVLVTADQGSDYCAHLVYRFFGWYRKVFQLHPHQRFHYLYLAADAGHGKACLKLGNLLKSGRLAFDDQGRLVPHRGKASPDDLEYAEYLLHRPRLNLHLPWYGKAMLGFMESVSSLSWWGFHQAALEEEQEEKEKIKPAKWKKWLEYWWVLLVASVVLRFLSHFFS
ncbi:hypothetical protein GCM10008938_33950 [Deinococcus roseus]|uniref:Uncharacterized protein n=1 Tax=Deinococcus roseus TaxID=392414 RepID=A0ABQ2D3Q1_9DEIO|nr:hypothetical protein GCM10008938_33950 [Deinococcus roseus]